MKICTFYQLVLKDVIVGYTFIGWQFFFFGYFSDRFLCVLVCIISDEKPPITLTFVRYCVRNLYVSFTVTVSTNFSVSLPFSSLLMMLSSVTQSYWTVWPCGLHTRLPRPSPTPRAYSNSSPSSWWCLPTISSSVVPFSSCLLSYPASGSFPVSQFFRSGGQSIGASASVLPMNIQNWFPLGLTSLISLQSKGLSNLLQHYSLKASVLRHSAFLLWCTLMLFFFLPLEVHWVF